MPNGSGGARRETLWRVAVIPEGKLGILDNGREGTATARSSILGLIGYFTDCSPVAECPQRRRIHSEYLLMQSLECLPFRFLQSKQSGVSP